MIHNPTIYNNTDWVRPSDWLRIDNLGTAGDQTFIGLVAVFPNTETYYHNKVALRSRYSYYVDWGDDTAETLYTDSQIAEHEYDYSALPDSSLCGRGYKQAIVKLRPYDPTGLGTYYLYTSHVPSSSTVKFPSSNWLDIRIFGTKLTTLSFSDGYVTNELLERIYVYQNTALLGTLLNLYSPNLIRLEANDLVTDNVTNMKSLLAYCKNIKYLGTTTWNTGKVTDMSYMFYFSKFDNLDISNFSSNTGVVVNCGAMFQGLSAKKITVGSINADGVSLMFYNSSVDTIVESMTYADTSKVMSNWFGGSIPTRFRNFDFTKINGYYVTTLQNLCLNSRNIEEIIFASQLSFLQANGASSIVDIATVGYNSLKKLRLPGVQYTFSVANTFITGANMNLLFADLWNCNGNISAIVFGTSRGTGYEVNDVISVDGGNNDSRLYVATIGVGGSVASVGWVNGTNYRPSRGTEYTTSIDSSTTTITGIGSGCQISIASIIAAPSITITGTPSATDPVTDRTIATTKNWTVVG